MSRATLDISDVLASAIEPTVEHFDVKKHVKVQWSDLRRVVNNIAIERGEWGGYPIPIERIRLVMEPRFPLAGLNGLKLRAPDDQEKPKDVDYTLLNHWFDYRRNMEILVCRDADGFSRAYFSPSGPGKRLTYWMNTLGVAAGYAWDWSVERRAIEKLQSLVSKHAFHCYQMVGGFLETSRRSGVTYLFRKLRPTIAMRPGEGNEMKVLAVMCLHPLGYYEESWAGVMCPTDDVVAHLMLMRGDEHWFWKKSNHHDMHEAGAGI